VVEPAASVLLVEVCLFCLNLGVINLICHEAVYVENNKMVIVPRSPAGISFTSW
jgi:hypothetical protein